MKSVYKVYFDKEVTGEAAPTRKYEIDENYPPVPDKINDELKMDTEYAKRFSNTSSVYIKSTMNSNLFNNTNSIITTNSISNINKNTVLRSIHNYTNNSKNNSTIIIMNSNSNNVLRNPKDHYQHCKNTPSIRH